MAKSKKQNLILKREKGSRKGFSWNESGFWIIGIAGTLISIVSYLLLKNLFLSLSCLLISVVVIYLAFNKRKEKKEDEKYMREKEFIHLFDYFAIYVETGLTPYSALKETMKFSSSYFFQKIQTLLSDIENDKTVVPFLTFCNDLESQEIRQVMIAIYKMMDEGGNQRYIDQFFHLFHAYSQNAKREDLIKEEKKFDNAMILPVIASSLMMIMIMVGVVTVMGDLINGF